MKNFRELLIVELVALVALLVVAAAMTVCAVVGSAMHADAGPTSSNPVALLFIYTIALGALPVFLIGAPGYVVLRRYHAARWPYVVMLGVAPGVVALAFQASLGLWSIVCGTATALLRHAICTQSRLNDSLRQNPLRVPGELER